MKNFLTKYLKRIFFYLIPLFFITNQKYTTCDDNLSLSEYPDINEELDKICQQNKFLCIMIDAIKYSFKSINSFSQTHEEKTYYVLSYQNVKSLNISCQNVSAEIEGNEGEIKDEEGKYIISFSNCTSHMDGKLVIRGRTYRNNFPTEIYLDKIIIFMNKIALKGEMHILFEYGMINNSYFYPIVDHDYEEQYIYQMGKIMENVFKNYTYQLKNIIELNEYQLLSQLKYFSDISNQFAKNFSFINQTLENNETKITYIAYNSFKYNSLINIYDYIYVPNLVVFFEYALNYNITYNEGNFTFDYMNFSKSKNEVFVGNIINKSAEFDVLIPPEESIEIWKIIKNDFNEKFKLYK